MPADQAAGERPVAEVSRGWTLRFAAAWLGLWMAYLVPVQLALPDQLAAFDHRHRIRDFGLINGLVGLAALVSLPLFGALCDRTRSRLGRRRVWLVAGSVVFAAGLLATGLAGSALPLALGWLLASLGSNMATAGLTATVADQVPDHQRGLVSAAIYGPQALGLVLGLVALGSVSDAEARYAVLAVAVLLLVAPFAVRGGEGAAPLPSQPLSLAAVLGGLRVAGNADFGWAFTGRLLVNLGNALGTTYLLFFLRDYLHRPDPDASLVVLSLIYVVFTLAATSIGGVLSDRLGRRRAFVALASVLQALAAGLLTGLPSYHSALLAAALLGAGYGAYMSVDQALVTEVLPDARDRARDLGVMNVGSVGPQAFGPLAASLVIAQLGGYRVLFAVAGVTSVAGALAVHRIRGVR